MTILQLQVFAAVAKARSFTRAAECLSFTQSAVSQMVQNLEKELGIPLFHRSRQGIVLTRDGEVMLKHAQLILDTTRIMKAEAAQAAELQSGTLRIGATPDIVCRFMTKLTDSFKQAFPQVDIVLFEGESAEINNWISDDIIDIGVTMFPAPELNVVTLIRDEMVVILPENHPLGKEAYLNVEHIKDHCFIMPSDIEMQKLLLTLHACFNVAIEVKDINTIQTMVEENMGFSILPRFYISRIASKLLILPFEPSLSQEIVLAVNDMEKVSRLAVEFINNSVSYIRKHRQEEAM